MRNDLVVVGWYQNALEASMARNRLEAEGIRSVVSDDHTVTMYWVLAPAMGGIKISVMTADVDRASRALGVEIDAVDAEELERLADESATRDGPEETADTVAADEPPLNPREVMIERAFKGAMFGVALLPLQFWVSILLMRIFFADDPIRSSSKTHLIIAAAIGPLLALVLLLWFGQTFFGIVPFPLLPDGE